MKKYFTEPDPSSDGKEINYAFTAMFLILSVAITVIQF